MQTETYFEEPEFGVKVTGDELIMGTGSLIDTITAIPINKIKFAALRRGVDWRPGVGFASYGLFTLFLVSGWGYLVSLVPMAWGIFILAHPSQRLYRLFVDREKGSNIPTSYPLKAYQGPKGRKCVEELAQAIMLAKRGPETAGAKESAKPAESDPEPRNGQE